MREAKKHLSVANALSCLALFIALGGAAYAATIGNKAVKTRHLGNGAVTTKKIRNGAVTTAKLRNDAVSTAKLADASVRSINLGGGVVTTPKLKNGAVDGSKLGASAVSTGKIEDGAVTGAKVSSSLLAQLVSNVSYVSAESVANAEDEPKTIAADCPAGKQVTGGGAVVKGADVEKVAITESAPALNAEGKRTGWRAQAREIDEEASSWSVEAFAICAEID